MFEICKAKNGQYYTRLIGKNGECLMVSEMFGSKPSAKRNAMAIDKLYGGMLDLDIRDMTHTVTLYPKIAAYSLKK